MRLTLLTYDSMVLHNAGYINTAPAHFFANELLKLVDEFAEKTGVNKDDVHWQFVTNSDWCKSMVIIYSRVSEHWTPTKNTEIYDNSYDPLWYPNLAKDTGSWISGSGCFVDIVKNPPQNHHSLFRTIVKS